MAEAGPGNKLRASTSALDAEDQDQEETPIPGAHNCPPARLFYRTFPTCVYSFFFWAVLGVIHPVTYRYICP